jgi:hypothetical protein
MINTGQVVFIILILFVFVINQTSPGIKIAINQEVISDYQKIFFPELIAKYSQFSIPDHSDSKKIWFFKISYTVTDIRININNLKSDNVKLSFLAPNQVTLEVSGAQVHGSARAKSTGLSADVDLWANNLKLKLVLSMDSIKRADVDRLVPHATLTSSEIEFDFDYKIGGGFAGWILDKIGVFFKGRMKDMLKDMISDMIKIEIPKSIESFSSKVPVFVDIPKRGLRVDYSLSNQLKVDQGFLLLPLIGTISNLEPFKLDQNLTPSPTPIELPDFDPNGKKIQVTFSSYSLATALRSLFLMYPVDVIYQDYDLPQDSPVRLNTDSLEILLKGIVKKYGKEKPAQFNIKLVEVPSLNFENDKVISYVVFECTVNIEVAPQNIEEVIKFRISVKLGATVILHENSNLMAKVDEVNMLNVKLIDSKLEESNLDWIDEIFNFAGKIGVNLLNDKYLSDTQLSIPSVEGVSFQDSTAKIFPGYIKIDLNPTFSSPVSLLQKKSRSHLKTKVKVL